ncbi:MAG: type II toxin-antitoxin system RelE/ParE family toxin [Rhodospirillaceae bacterium]|jgi:mRNA interferase RelE/StbE|nr:type II toxin-antitoxin system RelE/ParE family toxin [Rhodospirillaceae bacterium]
MVRILQTPTFKRAVKRLHHQQKLALDEAIRAIAEAPDIGEAKVGDLAGVRVHKFKMDKQSMLLAFEVSDGEGVVKLLALGSHENFYRDLKR